MLWHGKRQSSNVKGRRGMHDPSFGGIGSGGGLFNLLPMIFRFYGFKGSVFAILGIGTYGLLSGNLSSMLGSA